MRRVDLLIFLELSLSVLVSEPPFKMAEELDHGSQEQYSMPFTSHPLFLHFNDCTTSFTSNEGYQTVNVMLGPHAPCASVCPCSETMQIALMQQQEPIPDLLHEESLLKWNPFCSWYLSQESSSRKLYWKLLSSLRIGFILSYVFSYLSLFYFASIIYQRQL